MKWWSGYWQRHAERAASRKLKDSREAEEREQTLKVQRDKVVASLVEAGITPIRRFTSNLRHDHCTIYAIGRNQEILVVTVNHRGGMNISKL